MMLSERKRLNVRAAPSQEILRYSGLLRCEDCGRVMFGRRIHLKSGERVTYVCSTYNLSLIHIFKRRGTKGTIMARIPGLWLLQP